MRTLASNWPWTPGPRWKVWPRPVQVRDGVRRRRRKVMAGKADQMKGKAKEAVGDLTGNKDLKSEGKADRQAGEAKEKVGKVEEKVEEVIDKAKGVLHPK